MDDAAGDTELLVATIHHLVAALRDDPRFEPPGGKRGAALHEHLEDLLGAAEHRVSSPPDPAAPAPIGQAHARSLRETIMMLRAAFAALPWLESTRAPSVNLGSLYLTEECAKHLVRPDVDLVVVPDAEFMYATTSWPFGDVVQQTKGFTANTVRRPIVLNYPLADSDRLLLHPLFAHELGHACADEYDLVTEFEADLLQDFSFTQPLAEVVDRMTKVWTSGPTKINGTIRAWLRDWIEELLCDQLALAAMGPAYLWAFAGFVMPLGYGEANYAYPPNTVRVRLCLDHLERNGWTEWMQDTAPQVDQWLNRVASDAGDRMFAPLSFIRDQLLDAGEKLHAVAVKQADDYLLEPADFAQQAGMAAELLEKDILPVGNQEPLQPRAIVLGGWKEAFRRHEDSPTGIVRALEDPALQDLVGKAVELSTIWGAWEA